MIQELLSDPAMAALAKSLQGAATRQEALASNIANAETPGHVRQEVHFEEALAAAFGDGTGAPDELMPRLASLEFPVTDDVSRPPGPDGNNVEIELEMSELAKNSLRFDSSATVLSLKTRMLRTAIKATRRDIIAILQAIKRAGALQAELEII